MTGVIDKNAAVAAFLPATIKVANGDLIKIDWQPAKEYNAPSAYPYGTFERVRVVPLTANDILEPLPTTQAQEEAITYTAGQDIYPVEEQHIVAVTELLATVGGVDDTALVLDTDFEIYTSPGRWGPDAIRFLPLGTKPDDGTDFVLSYTERRLSALRQRMGNEVWRLELHVKDISLPSTRGATVAYVKSYLAEQLGDGLLSYLDHNKGKNLVTADPQRGAQFRVLEIQELGDLPVDEGESLIRIGFDLTLRRRALTEVGTDRTITGIEIPQVEP